MLDADIAKNLPASEWKVTKTGAAYCHPQTRIDVSVAVNHSLTVLSFEESDPFESATAFADDLLAVIGPSLSPAVEEALVLRLGQNLIEWQVGSGREDDTIGDMLRGILQRLDAAMAAKVSKQPNRKGAPLENV